MLTPKKWDEQYEQGKWDYLVDEKKRYEIIASYCNFDKEKPYVLDVGCGSGILLSYISYDKYVGIDFSKEALEKAQKKNDCTFIHTSVEHFETTKKFNVIVFNEILYYVDWKKTLEKYEQFLLDNGRFLISMWIHPKTKLIWGEIVNKYECVKKEVVSGDKNNQWNIGLFKKK